MTISRPEGILSFTVTENHFIPSPMILANVTFGPRRRHAPDVLEDAADSYLAQLLKGGQICEDYFLTWMKGRLNAHVFLAASDAHEKRHHSARGRKELKQITALFGKAPVWKILDDDANQRPISWKSAAFFCLYTHAFSDCSPIRRETNWQPVPVFRLPLSPEQKESVYFWQESYRAHDDLWLDCGTLEVAAYREMAVADSALSTQGRELCQEIEAATGIPTFYYLQRYWGYAKGEAERPCPGCGRPWKRTEILPEHDIFEFKCDPCRLISSLGDSTDDARKARIGEFSGKKKTSLKRR